MLAVFFQLVPLQAQEFQLAAPQIGPAAVNQFFVDSIGVPLYFDLDGAEIRYTLDGTIPGRQSTLYVAPITLHQSAELHFAAFHPDFQPSDPVCLQFFRIEPDFEPRQAELAVAPSEKYPGKGAETLHDLVKGHQDLSKGQWLGFDGKNLDYTFALKKPKKAKMLLVSVLSSPGSWIFPPRRIEVWASRHRKQGFEKVGELALSELPAGSNNLEEKLITLSLAPHSRARYWRIVVENYGPLPDWHPGKGQPAWLFVDEIILQP